MLTNSLFCHAIILWNSSDGGQKLRREKTYCLYLHQRAKRPLIVVSNNCPLEAADLQGFVAYVVFVDLLHHLLQF